MEAQPTASDPSSSPANKTTLVSHQTTNSLPSYLCRLIQLSRDLSHFLKKSLLSPIPSPSSTKKKTEMLPPTKRQSPSAEAKKANKVSYNLGEDVCRVSPPRQKRQMTKATE